MSTVLEPSYCCVSLDTIDISKKIRAWIAEREAEGWTVEFSVRKDPSAGLGVMWQCVKHAAGRHETMEFTDCISMSGREFRMN
jgi:hypothetical protein